MEKKYSFPPLALVLLLTSLIFTSCSSDDSSDDDLNGNCAITAMTLGNFYRTIFTTGSMGQDTTYLGLMGGSAYAVYIDQQNQEIYNVDSLPYGSKLNRVLVGSITADGVVSYKSLWSGNDTIFSTTDSIDFTVPRFFNVHSTDGTSKRTYKVTISAHQVQPEQFTWKRMERSNAEIAALTQQKAYIQNNKLIVFGYDGSSHSCLKSDINGNISWTRELLQGLPDDIDISSIILYKDAFYVVVSGQLYTSSDGVAWTAISSDTSLDLLVACGSETIYGIKDNVLYKSKDAAHWEKDTLDDSEDKIPSSNITSVYFSSTVNNNIEFILLAGERNGESELWKRENDLTGLTERFWSYYPKTEENPYSYPNLKTPTLINYDQYQLVVGYNNDTLSPFYVSKDGGRTWIPDSTVYTLPENITSAPQSYSIAVDKDNYIWFMCGGSGQIWKGRLNRLGFKEYQQTYE